MISNMYRIIIIQHPFLSFTPLHSTVCKIKPKKYKNQNPLYFCEKSASSKEYIIYKNGICGFETNNKYTIAFKYFFT